MRFHSRFPARFAGLVLALALAACGDEGAPPGPGPSPEDPPPGGLTAADARPIADAVIPGLFLSIAAITQPMPSLAGPLFGVAEAATLGAGARLSSPVSCPSFEPDPFPDADTDGVPDNTVFSFDSDTCDETTESGTTNYFGSVRVSDPGANLGYDLEINGLGITFTPAGPGNSEGIRWDGFRSLQGNSSVITLDEGFDFSYLVGPSTVVRLRTQWDVSFVADVAGSIAFGSDLPAGDLDVDGALTAEGEGERFILVVNTLAPLAFDPLCYDFVGGTIRIYAQGRESEGAVQVTFNACGVAPTIVYVSNPV